MLQIKEDDKFFSRLLSKESSMANPSCRVYYGGVPIGVPFVWEAKPGTPKHPNHFSQSQEKEIKATNTIFPPLTPPPSFNQQPKKSFSSSKKSKIFQGFFPKMMKHRRQISSASTLSSSSESTTTTATRMLGRSRSLSSPRSLFDFAVNDRDPEEVEEEGVVEEMMSSSPRSILCFGLGGGRKIRSPSLG
uniref:Uncharacterized protein n=1 Tax=Opuntia streptacantha TaxID=393608 RepID=A0A7C8ZTJ3_OPUST